MYTDERNSLLAICYHCICSHLNPILFHFSLPLFFCVYTYFIHDWKTGTRTRANTIKTCIVHVTSSFNATGTFVVNIAEISLAFYNPFDEWYVVCWERNERKKELQKEGKQSRVSFTCVTLLFLPERHRKFSNEPFVFLPCMRKKRKM